MGFPGQGSNPTKLLSGESRIVRLFDESQLPGHGTVAIFPGDSLLPNTNLVPAGKA